MASLIKYKNTKTVDELVEYLENEKNVTYNVINKEEAKKILYRYNYINVITPFKYKFAKYHPEQSDMDDPFKNNEGRHVYERPVEFAEYFKEYQEERKDYPIIWKNLMDFETKFKSIAAHELLIHLKSNGNELLSDSQLEYFLSTCAFRAKNSSWINQNFSSDNIDYWFDKVLGQMEHKNNLFVYFDHFNLGQWEILFAGLDEDLQEKIFDQLKKTEVNLNTKNVYDFLRRYKIVKEFRNCVAHNNSVRVLIRFRNIKTNQYRNLRERKKYVKVYNFLRDMK